VVETNLMQRSFSEMSHTEKAAVIATQHGKLFSQGKRNDILRELQMLENPGKQAPEGTSAQVEHKLKSRDIVAMAYGLSKDTVARYLRIHHLIPELKARLDRGDFAFIPAVTLSFLKEAEQAALDTCLEREGLVVDMKTAETLRQLSGQGKLDADSILSVLTGEASRRPSPSRTPAVKIRKAVYARYFQPNQPAKEVQDIVEKALEQYFGQ
jgi:ParB family chromosome partitioning protein